MYQLIGPSNHITLSTLDVNLLVLLLVWEIIWKGIALWKAGRHNQLAWFICLLVINTVGILEILYLMFFQEESVAAKKNDET